jgi:outer membrane PBP1 activator LpoA protein
MVKQIRTRLCVVFSAVMLSGCSSLSQHSYSTVGGSPWQGNSQEVWDSLQQTSSAQLSRQAAGANDPIKAGWIQLALLSKRDSRNTNQLVNDILAWRNQYPNHPGNSLLPDNATLTSLLTQANPAQVAILLPERGALSSAGQAVRAGIMNSYYSSGIKQNVKFYDTTSGTSMNDLYQQAITDGANAVIGPLVKADVQSLASNGNFSVQTLALNYTSPTFGSLPTNFYEFGLLPEDDVAQMAARARREGGSHAIVIAPQNAYGQRMMAAFSNQWQANGGSIQDTYIYTSQMDFNAGIAHLLKVDPDADKRLSQSGADRSTLSQQRRQDFDVIILFGNSQDAHVIVPLLRYYYANNVPIFATSSVVSGNPTSDMDLNGVTVCDIPFSMQASRSVDGSLPSDKLTAVGQDAYTISQNLPRMQALPHFPLYGATGALYLSSDHQIHRRIPCTTIQNGTL